MRFTLPAGRELAITDLNFHWTYGGLLLGRPDAAMNRDLVARALKKAKESCSWLPVHLLPPEVSEPDCLPGSCWIIQLRSDSLPGAHEFWSGLVVVWFAEYDPARPLVDQVQAAVRDLEWDALALGWEP